MGGKTHSWIASKTFPSTGLKHVLLDLCEHNRYGRHGCTGIERNSRTVSTIPAMVTGLQLL